MLTARLVRRLRYHRNAVRDCSWHPTLPLMATGELPPPLLLLVLGSCL